MTAPFQRWGRQSIPNRSFLSRLSFSPDLVFFVVFFVVGEVIEIIGVKGGAGFCEVQTFGGEFDGAKYCQSRTCGLKCERPQPMPEPFLISNLIISG
jgi:hypothetical protein